MALTELFRIGRDAELRTTPSGQSVCNIVMVYDYYDPQGERQRSPQWVEATLWGKQAESLSKYLVKGQQAFASVDDLHIETYTDRDGVPKSKLVGKIVVIRLAGGKPAESAAPQRQQPARQQAPAPSTKRNFDDGDIPF